MLLKIISVFMISSYALIGCSQINSDLELTQLAATHIETRISLTTQTTPEADKKITHTPIIREQITTPSLPEAPIVSPYIDVIVNDVGIRYLDTSPIQVELTIVGSLPDGCKYDYYSVENRLEDKIKVSLKGIHPGNYDCEPKGQNIEYVLLLGRDMSDNERGFSKGKYVLVVNNFLTEFVID